MVESLNGQQYIVEDGEVVPYEEEAEEVSVTLPTPSQQEKTERDEAIDEAVATSTFDFLRNVIAEAAGSKTYVSDIQGIMNRVRALEGHSRSQAMDGFPEAHLLAATSNKFLNPEGIQLLYHLLAKELELKIQMIELEETTVASNSKKGSSLEEKQILSNLLEEVRQRIK